MNEMKYITQINVDVDKNHNVVEQPIAASAIVAGSAAHSYITALSEKSKASVTEEAARAKAAEANLQSTKQNNITCTAPIKLDGVNVKLQINDTLQVSTDGKLGVKDYQSKNDNTLLTTDKTVPGAINEVLAKTNTKQASLTPIEPVVIDPSSNISVLYDNETIKLNADKKLFANYDEKSIKSNTSGAYVNIDNDWIIYDANDKLTIKPRTLGDFTNTSGEGKFITETTGYTKTQIDNTFAPRSFIGDGLLTIQKNGTTICQFKANSISDGTANILVPTKTSDLTNDSDFTTNTELAKKQDIIKAGTGIVCSDGVTISIANDVKTDVQIAGTSITTSGVANIPVAGTSNLGVIKGINSYGTYIESDGIGVVEADETKLSVRGGVGTDNYAVVTTSNFDMAVKKALTDNMGPAYTATEQEAARNRLGVTSGVSDVKVNGTSIVTSGVANIPISAGVNSLGLTGLANNSGLANSSGQGYLYIAETSNSGINNRAAVLGNGYGAITTANLDYAVKAALSDAKGISVPAAVGTYILKAARNADNTITFGWE